MCSFLDLVTDVFVGYSGAMSEKAFGKLDLEFWRGVPSGD